MKKQKIKKGKHSVFSFWKLLTVKEKCVVAVPVVAALALLVVVLLGARAPKPVDPLTAHAGREMMLSTEGDWESFGEYGIDVWMPTSIPQEELDSEYSSYMKLCAQRDKGNFPELTVGTIIVPDTDGRELSIEHDLNAVLDVIRPYIGEAFAVMFNGTQPGLMVDLNIIDAGDGTKMIEAKGTAELTVVYEDPKKPGEPYAELTDTNIYYMVRIFNGWPVIAWGTWDYSTYKGEELTIQAVNDAMTSVIRTDGQEIKKPFLDDFKFDQPLETIPYEGAIEDESVSDTPTEEFESYDMSEPAIYEEVDGELVMVEGPVDGVESEHIH